MLKNRLLLSSILFLALLGCSNKSELKEFTYRYSMESIANYKVEFQLNPDTTFHIIQNNYFFDRYDGISKPKEVNGVLSDNEFNSFVKLIEKSDIEKIKDSYGFENNTDNDNSMLYIVELNRNGKSKFVTVNLEENNGLSKEFNEMIAFTNLVINNKLNLSE